MMKLFQRKPPKTKTEGPDSLNNSNMILVPQSNDHDNHPFVANHQQHQPPYYPQHHDASIMPLYTNHQPLHMASHTVMPCPHQCQLQPTQQSFAYPIQLNSKDNTTELVDADNHTLSVNTLTHKTQLVSMPLYQNNQVHQTSVTNIQPPKYANNPHYTNQFDSMKIQNQPQSQRLYQNQQQVYLNHNITESHNLENYSASLSKQAEENVDYRSERPNAHYHQCCQFSQDKTDGKSDMPLEDLFSGYEKSMYNMMSLAATLKNNLDILMSQKTIVMHKETTDCGAGVDVLELI